MTAVGYISDTEEIIKTSWSNFQHNGVAAFKLSERSPFSPAVSAKDLLRGRTEVIIVCRIRRINLHPVESDGDYPPDSISDTSNWLNWNGHLDIPNESEHDCDADHECNVKLGNGINPLESPEHRGVSDAPNVPGLIWPTQRSMKQAEKGLMTVSGMDTRRNKRNKKK